MNKPRTPHLVVIAGLALALSGCAQLKAGFAGLVGHKQVAVRPIAEHGSAPAAVGLAPRLSPPLAAAPRPADRLYLQATAALRARDYGLALELLQMARTEDPSSGRILNALAVTYDKLGRFDLSERYYTAALQTDPRSKVVQENMQYSAMLQGRVETPVPAADAQAAPAAPVPTAHIHIARAEGEARVQSALLVGRPLLIVDASGGRGLGPKVSARLAERGWSVSRTMPTAVSDGGAVLNFPGRHAHAAKALARTLPFSVDLVACSNACDRLTLTLGAKTRWRS